jgi:hypothetical protein
MIFVYHYEGEKELISGFLVVKIEGTLVNIDAGLGIGGCDPE